MKIKIDEIDELDVSTLNVKQGDILLFRTKERVSESAYEMILSKLEHLIGFKVPIIFLEDGAGLLKVDKEKLLAMIEQIKEDENEKMVF